MRLYPASILMKDVVASLVGFALLWVSLQAVSPEFFVPKWQPPAQPGYKDYIEDAAKMSFDGWILVLPIYMLVLLVKAGRWMLGLGCKNMYEEMKHLREDGLELKISEITTLIPLEQPASEFVLPWPQRAVSPSVYDLCSQRHVIRLYTATDAFEDPGE